MRVMVVGLGYVGAVAAAGLAKAGHEVTGVDIDRTRLAKFNSGHVDVSEPGLTELFIEMLKTRRLKCIHPDELNDVDQQIFLVCTGTPADVEGKVDLSQVLAAVKWIVSKTTGSITLIMKSTVPPGTGEIIIREYLSDTRAECHYVMNPEFLSEGQALKGWFNPDRIVIGGDNDEAIRKTRELYKDISAPFVITSITTAEIIKYAANAFLATKISFINEIAKLCERVGGDIEKVSEGIGLDKRIGPSFLKAGVGYGGSCFPKDTRALDVMCLEKGLNCELLRAVIEVNNKQRLLAVYKLKNSLGSLKGKTVAILGLAFKPGTDDIRDAPALDIIRLLCKEKAIVQVYDPQAMSTARSELPGEVCYCDSTMSAVRNANAVIVVTEWDEFIKLDWNTAKTIMKEPYAVVDGRNCLAGSLMRELGFRYEGFGRLLLKTT
jgi:UDPglucose 6-dehydrogenase